MRRTAALFLVLAACSSTPSSDDPTTPPPGTTPDGGLVQPGEDGGVPPVDGGEPDASKPVASGQLNVLSLNLHCLKTEGTAFATNEARFDAIAAAVAAEGVDVILAQEVCLSLTASARTMLLAALDKATGATWSSAAAFAHKAWEGTPDEADEYVGIFSRGALSAEREMVHRAQGPLRRVSLGATIASPLRSPAGAEVPVRVYTLHLEYATPAARADQARELASGAMVEADDAALGIDVGAGAFAMPIVIAGDFNAQSAADAPKALRDYGFVETSDSASTTRIDHVFAHRTAPFAASATKTLFTGSAAVSDHPGVYVRFVPAAPKAARLTRIVANGSFGAPLTVRGDRAPLTWERGWPAFARPSGKPGVAIVTSEIASGTFAYKFLRSDTDWAIGANASGAGEADNTSTPSFN